MNLEHANDDTIEENVIVDPILEEDLLDYEEDEIYFQPITKNVLNWTHNDLDGISCSVLVKKLFTKVDTEICTYSDINIRMEEFLNKYAEDKVIPNYDLILITDIYVSDIIADRLNQFSDETGIQLLMLDHHSDTNLNPYPWAIVYTSLGDVKTCGATMIYDYFIKANELFLETEEDDIAEFVELVRLYDTWEWSPINKWEAKRLSDFLYVIGVDAFTERFVNNTVIDFSTSEEAIMATEMDRISRYINEKETQMMTIEIGGYKAGVVFAEQNQSILGNELCIRHPEIDLAAIIDVSHKKVSFRTIKDNIHLGIFAKRYANGGGHPKAAGFELDDNVSLQFFNLIFKDY